MAKIVILPALESKLFDLVFILHDKEYFGFVETAIAYVDDIIDFIYTIPKRKHKKTKNNKYGSYYCSYKKNPATTWFICFDFEEEVYLVKNITNNHTEDYTLII
ncbi:MAG: hypothetical protein ABIU77_27355 [Ferruginibacter sp.]